MLERLETFGGYLVVTSKIRILLKDWFIVIFTFLIILLKGSAEDENLSSILTSPNMIMRAVVLFIMRLFKTSLKIGEETRGSFAVWCFMRVFDLILDFYQEFKWIISYRLTDFIYITFIKVPVSAFSPGSVHTYLFCQPSVHVELQWLSGCINLVILYCFEDYFGSCIWDLVLIC